jgi:thioredoxin 1
VFRENVVLYSQAGALPAEHLNDLVTQVRKVDMEDVRRQIAEHESGSEHHDHDHDHDDQPQHAE